MKQKNRVMIDYIKLNISRSLFDLINLDFFKHINLETGEMRFYETAKHKNLTIIRKGDYIVLEGSLHKYHNDGQHNHNDFDYSMLIQTVDNLCQEIQIKSDESYLQNLEFGINIKVDFDPTDFLKNQVICYKGQKPTYSGPRNGKGYLLEFEQYNYIVKLYDKGGQYDLDEKILRFEFKTKKMVFIKNSGIKILADLKNLSRLKILRDILLNIFDDILICEHVQNEIISEHDRELYLNRINSTYWSSLLPDSKTFQNGSKNQQYRAASKKYYKSLKQFKYLISKYNLDITKKTIQQEFENKSARLLSVHDD